MFSDKSPNAELKLIDFGLSKVFFAAVSSPDPDRERIHAFRGGDAELHRSGGLHARLPRLRLQQVLRHVVAGDHLLLPPHRAEPAPLAALLGSPAPGLRENPLPAEVLGLAVPRGEAVRAGPPPAGPRQATDRSASGGPLTAASQAQNHPWLRRQYPAVPGQFPPSLVEHLQAFQGFNRLKKAAMTAVAYHLNSVGDPRGSHP